MGNALLIGKDIEVSYYKKPVLQGVSVEVEKGEIVALIGPNGAGKSTLMKAIFGLLKPIRGRVFFEDEDITGRSPHLNAKRGIGYFIQGGSVFTNLTVLENLELGGYILDRPNLIKERIKEVFNLFPDMEHHKKTRAGLLSGGEKQMLALGILLMRHPKILLLDEPSAGLSPILVKKILEKIKEINIKLGISILLVEQSIIQALSISHRVYLLKAGKVEACDTPENIKKEKKIKETFFK